MTLSQIYENEALEQMWEQFRRKNYFVGELIWDEVVNGVKSVIEQYIIKT